MSQKKKTPTVVTSAELEARERGGKSDAQISSERIHTGKIITVDRDRIRYPDGSEADVDIVRHSGASAVVPFLSDPEGEDPQILLLRQYRYAADGYLYEIPAGRLDPDETPADCAARELKEETGCTAKQMEPLLTMVTTPGFTDERIHLFMATDLTHGQAAREADEFADVVVMRLSEALELIQRGEIVDGKTALAILYTAGFKTG
ncbi:MAG: ADP-ribose pyrophosphatase [Gemmatimonadetes bacterium]|nr:MAG: ADP-ribose pyrophosphatase [Gemmatimonadota bacterium]HMC55424.1 NUDIX hydrolase [Gemmatimonadaceae bacterium]